ncbi:MAG: threonine/serine exporter family protein [Clostridia bacterium]|nr:threonine/serine exporter family protein [Clostridia bacterium]
MTEIMQIITGCIGSLGFAVLFNIRGKKLIFATLGGLLSWSLFLLLGFFIENEPVRYFIVSLLISLYSEIMARELKTPTTTFIYTSLVPLIPGGSLYYTMSAGFAGDLTGFLDKGLYTLSLAVALALGIVLESAVMKMVLNSREQHRKKKLEVKK